MGEVGQLGIGRKEGSSLPKKVSCLSVPIQKVSCGNFHALLLTENGKVYATGSNESGQLGVGNKKSSVVPVKLIMLDSSLIVDIAAGQHSGAVSAKGELFLWGEGFFGESLFPKKFLANKALEFKKIRIGEGFGCALDHKGIFYILHTAI